MRINRCVCYLQKIRECTNIGLLCKKLDYVTSFSSKLVLKKKKVIKTHPTNTLSDQTKNRAKNFLAELILLEYPYSPPSCRCPTQSLRYPANDQLRCCRVYSVPAQLSNAPNRPAKFQTAKVNFTSRIQADDWSYYRTVRLKSCFFFLCVRGIAFISFMCMVSF